MGIICSIFDHKLEPHNFWGEEAEYVHFKCSRCNHQEIYCHYEGKNLSCDEMGKKILEKMFKDKEFSKACHIHSQFAAAELKHAFSFKKKEEAFKELRERFGLTSTIRPACPVEMFKAGLWVDKKKDDNGERKSKKSSPEVTDVPFNFKLESNEINSIEMENNNNNKSFKPMNFDNQEYTNKVKLVEYSFEKSRSVKELTMKELERLLQIYVDQEKYEKAAEIHKKIEQMKAVKK
jgi:hypothetical protein